MLTGRNVYLRKLEENDLEKSLLWINDPEIMIRIGIRGPRTISNQKEWFDKMIHDPSKKVFAICLKDKKVYIGNISLYDIDPVHGHAGFSIFIGDKKNCGKGYGIEAMKLLLRFALDDLN